MYNIAMQWITTTGKSYLQKEQVHPKKQLVSHNNLTYMILDAFSMAAATLWKSLPP